MAPAVRLCAMGVDEDVARWSTGSDKEAILDLVTSRSNGQRQEVIAAYKCSFGKVQEYISSSQICVC